MSYLWPRVSPNEGCSMEVLLSCPQPCHWLALSCWIYFCPCDLHRKSWLVLEAEGLSFPGRTWGVIRGQTELCRCRGITGEGSLLRGCDPWHSSVLFPNIPQQEYLVQKYWFYSSSSLSFRWIFKEQPVFVLIGCCEPQGPPRIIKSSSWPRTNPKITHQEDAVGSNHACPIFFPLPWPLPLTAVTGSY